MRTCSEKGCERKHMGRGFCSLHYYRNFRENCYKIRPRKTDEERFWANVEKTASCWLWTASLDAYGYGNFVYNKHTSRAHRYSFYLHNGFEADPCCLHSCDNPKCVNPDHLRAGTQSDNIRDVYLRNRNPAFFRKGSSCHQSKLNEDQVRQIRRLAQEGVRAFRLAAMFGLHPSSIGSIIRRETWKHI